MSDQEPQQSGLPLSEALSASTEDAWELKNIYSKVDSPEDLQLLLEETSAENATAINESFDAVYQETPDLMSEGRVLMPVVMTTSDNIEQELSVTIPVATPEEEVKQYTCLYGSDNPNRIVKMLVQAYTDCENNLLDLYGVEIPLIHDEGEWKIHQSRIGEDTSSFLSRMLISVVPALFKREEDMVEFGKTYHNPSYKQEQMEAVTEAYASKIATEDISIKRSEESRPKLEQKETVKSRA